MKARNTCCLSQNSIRTRGKGAISLFLLLFVFQTQTSRLFLSYLRFCSAKISLRNKVAHFFYSLKASSGKRTLRVLSPQIFPSPLSFFLPVCPFSRKFGESASVGLPTRIVNSFDWAFILPELRNWTTLPISARAPPQAISGAGWNSLLPMKILTGLVCIVCVILRPARPPAFWS